MTSENFIKYVIQQYQTEANGWIDYEEVHDFFEWYVKKGYAQPVIDYILGNAGTEGYQ